jgi:hypothetical protein
MDVPLCQQSSWTWLLLAETFRRSNNRHVNQQNLICLEINIFWPTELYYVEESSFIWMQLIIFKYQPRCRLLNPSFSCLLRRVKSALLFFLSSVLLCVSSCPSRIPFSALGRVLSLCNRQSSSPGNSLLTVFFALLRVLCSELYYDWHHLFLRNILLGALLGKGVGLVTGMAAPDSRVQGPAKWIFCTKKKK